MKFVCFDHTGKSIYLVQKLVEHGHEQTRDVNDLDLLLVDCDWPWAHPRPQLIAAAHERGAVVATYPHGGMLTSFVYDGICDPDPKVAVRLEHAEGALSALSPYRDDLNQHACGWLFSPTAEFQPVDQPRKILFGPQHPNIEIMVNRKGNGHDPSARINQQIYKQLIGLDDVEVIVSLVGPPWKNGVWQHPNVTLVQNERMWFPQTFEMIQAADVIVATGTMAAAAVALGKPTVMFAQGDTHDYVNGEYVQADHHDQIAELLRYPVDVEDGPLGVLIGAVAAGELDGVAEWRNRWVGDDGTDTAVRMLEGLASRPEPASQSVTVQGVMARADGSTD